MGSLNLDSCWARFGRAEEHSKTLHTSLDDWFKSGAYGFAHQANAERTRFSLVARLLRPPDLVQWSLILCDALAGFRCSLDHLIWAIALKQDVLSLPDPPKENFIAFPIGDSDHKFRSAAGKNIKGFSPAVWAAVESMQPYNRKHPTLPPLLGILQDVDNVNKHRLLRVAPAVFNGGDIRNLSYPIKPGESVRVIVSTAEIEEGAEAVAVVLSEPSEDDVTYDFHGHIAIALAIEPAPHSPVKWVAIHFLLAELAREVRIVIDTVASAA